MIELMADNPRKIFNIEGGIRPGDRADITIIDFNNTFKVTPRHFLSKGKSTPFEGLELQGIVKATIQAGKIAYTQDNVSIKEH